MKKLSFLRFRASEFPFSIGIPAIIWQALFFYIPLLFIIFSSIVKVNQLGAIEGITLSKLALFLTPTYAKVIASSLLLAFSNAVICLLIAYPIAYYLAFVSKKFKNLLLFLLIVPFWTNFLLHVYAWFFVLEREGFLNNLLRTLGLIHQPIHFLNSIFAIMIMMVYYYLPFMLLPIYSSLERFEYRMIEASLDLGANWFQTFYRIMLPLTMRGVRSGFFLVYIPSFGEFAIPELMGGDKHMFVGSVVSHYILGEQTGSLGAAFTVISCVILLITAIFFYWLSSRFLKPKVRYG
ncbi:MAG TPA: ABC transporter permease [Rhabdochlamydiaceae bacterium]|nr:ABC transporter permease [Rhabdochlamydiaceae bacterium]